MIRIRAAKHDDISAIAELWCHAFPGHRSFEERAQLLEQGGRHGGLETVAVADEDGVVGAYKLLRLTQYITGAALPTAGLAAVAVSHSHRRQGLGRQLCGHALRSARERGDVLSALYPFRPAFYHALGWGLVARLHRHRFRTATLPEGPRRRRPVRLAGPEDLARIAACYGRVAERSNGPLRRDEALWHNRLGGGPVIEPIRARDSRDPAAWRARRRGGLHILVHDDDGVAGYLLARYREGPPERRALHIVELIAERRGVYAELLGWVSSQRDQWPVTVYDARPAERLEHRLTQPRSPGERNRRRLWFPSAHMLQGPMLRIVNIEGAFAGRRWWAARPGAPDDGRERCVVRIEVDDPELPENRGPWVLRLAGQEMEMRPADDERVDASLTLDAATLARVYAGELSPSEACGLGGARIDGSAALLDRMFATFEKPWLLDEF
ncbi:MAG: GNAT family N-acetyltransferase [Gemmatimonadota bacterium]